MKKAKSDINNSPIDMWTKSSTDLLDGGSLKVLVDDIQYNIDGIVSSQSMRGKAKSAANLYIKVTSSRQDMIMLQSSGVAIDILKLPAILLQDQYSLKQNLNLGEDALHFRFELSLYLLAIVHALSLDLCSVSSSGSGSELPDSTFDTLLRIIESERSSISKPLTRRTEEQSPECLGSPTSFHKRRKLHGSHSGNIVSPLSGSPIFSESSSPVTALSEKSRSSLQLQSVRIPCITSSRPTELLCAFMSRQYWSCLLQEWGELISSEFDDEEEGAICVAQLSLNNDKRVQNIEQLSSLYVEIVQLISIDLLRMFLQCKVSYIASNDFVSDETADRTSNGVSGKSGNFGSLRSEFRHLQRYQAALLGVRDDSTTFLDSLLSIIYEDYISDSCLRCGSVRMTRLANCLGILEASCFLCPNIEVALARMKVSGKDSVKAIALVFQIMQTCHSEAVQTVDELVDQYLNRSDDAAHMDSSQSSLVVNVTNIWVLCARVLVNATYNSSILMNQTSDITNAEILIDFGALKYSKKLLSQLGKWRNRTRRCNNDTLAPDAPRGLKLPYDLTLLMLTLCTNMCSAAYKKIDGKALQSAAKFPEFLWGKLDNLQENVYSDAEDQDGTITGNILAITQVALKFLRDETSVYYNDMMKTESSSSSSVSASSSSSDEPHEPATVLSTALPIAEIILSANLIMLLYRLCHSYDNSQDSSMKQMMDYVTCALPESSWVLPSRVLKSFLSLQCKSGVIISSAKEILKVLSYMDADIAVICDNKERELEKEGANRTPSKAQWISKSLCTYGKK